ncbi:MAG: ATP-binding protein [Turicibacter sp.]|nr:ATP-binding protein [Turicibacter sp.]
MENNEIEKSKIVNASMFLDALKNSGYKGTDNAVAEIVDNSFDAHAQNVFIIGEQNVAGNSEKRIVSFAFLDDGDGMNYETLKGCLTIGYTTNQQRKGIGRFGVGLPQASIFVCNRVEVYSWQNGLDSCQKVYLDVEEIKEKNLNEISEPVYASIPERYSKFISWKSKEKKFDFSQHGTLVVWTNCTHIDYKKWKTCVDHMSKDLGRKYRKFLYSDERSISMIELISQEYKKILPNDPLYLMPQALECVPSDLDVFIKNKYESKPYGEDSAYDTCLFEIYKASTDSSADGVDLELTYEENGEKKKGTVHITYSIVKKEYYSPAYLKTDKKPGSLPYGSNSSVLSKNTGISIVRNDREIQFGSFGFFDIYNQPELRWWGIEISFTSELDTAFGVSNNKQSVDLKPLSKDEMKEYGLDEIKTIWHQLALEIIPTIKEMTARNSKLRSELEVTDDPTPSTASTISTVADGGEVLIVDAPTNEDEIVEAAKEQLEAEGNDSPTDEQIRKLIDSKVRVVPVFTKSKRDSFVDISYAAGTLSIILNANHEFYNKLVKKILDDENDKVPFELFLIAVMKSIKNLDLEHSDAMDKLMYDINDRIAKYMMEYNKNNE